MQADACRASCLSPRWCLVSGWRSEETNMQGLLPSSVPTSPTISDLPFSTTTLRFEIFFSHLSLPFTLLCPPVLLTCFTILSLCSPSPPLSHRPHGSQSLPLFPCLFSHPSAKKHPQNAYRLLVCKTKHTIPVFSSRSPTSSPSTAHCVYTGQELKEVSCSFFNEYRAHSVSVLSHYAT